MEPQNIAVLRLRTCKRSNNSTAAMKTMKYRVKNEAFTNSGFPAASPKSFTGMLSVHTCFGRARLSLCSVGLTSSSRVR